MLNVLVAIDFRFVFSALRAVCVVAARDGRESVFWVARVLLRKSKARDDVDVLVGRVAARARTELWFARVVETSRFTTLVALRDTTDESRAVVFVPEFVRDKESVPRTAADDAPMDSATMTIEIISFFISVHYRLAKNKNIPQVQFAICGNKKFRSAEFFINFVVYTIGPVYLRVRVCVPQM